MDWITDPQAWIALVTLTVLELVLGIDNIIFLTILVGKLKPERRDAARRLGLALAMLMRIALLVTLAWMIRLSNPLFEILGHPFAGRDLILIGGGLFLLAKSTHEIHDKLEGEERTISAARAPSFRAVIIQVVLMDAVFSLDSVITAVGMVEELVIMVSAVVIAVALMMIFAKPIGEFVDRHPTVRMLALSFLLLVGVTLIADGLGQHISKGYIYFAMAFSVLVEALNLRLRKLGREPVHLRKAIVQRPAAAVSRGKVVPQ